MAGDYTDLCQQICLKQDCTDLIYVIF